MVGTPAFRVLVMAGAGVLPFGMAAVAQPPRPSASSQSSSPTAGATDVSDLRCLIVSAAAAGVAARTGDAASEQFKAFTHFWMGRVSLRVPQDRMEALMRTEAANVARMDAAGRRSIVEGCTETMQGVGRLMSRIGANMRTNPPPLPR